MDLDQSDGGQKVSLDIYCSLKVEEVLGGSIRSPRAKNSCAVWFGGTGGTRTEARRANVTNLHRLKFKPVFPQHEV